MSGVVRVGEITRCSLRCENVWILALGSDFWTGRHVIRRLNRVSSDFVCRVRDGRFPSVYTKKILRSYLAVIYLFIYLFVPGSNVLVTTVVSYTDWSLHFNELKGSDARMYDLRLEVQLGEK